MRTVVRPTPRVAAPGRRRAHWVLPLLLVIVGVVVLGYPVAATQYNNHQQRRFAAAYQAEISAVPQTQRAASLAAARAYNGTLGGVPILDPYLGRAQAEHGGPWDAYLRQLSDTEAMARVRVPAAGIDLPVRHGTGDDVLAEGVGHLYGTSLPVGGPGTHAVLTSHTGYADATLFDHIHDLVPGDMVFIDVAGETLAYEVDGTKTVLPDEIGDLVTHPGQDELTLFTCTPYGVNTHRLLVHAHRVEYDPRDAAAPTRVDTAGIEPWMYRSALGVGAGVVIMAGIVARAVADARRAPGPRRAL